MRIPPKVEYYPCLLLIITRIEVEDGAYIIYIFYFNSTLVGYSCLENPMDGGAWKAAVHGVAEGRT